MRAKKNEAKRLIMILKLSGLKIVGNAGSSVKAAHFAGSNDATALCSGPGVGECAQRGWHRVPLCTRSAAAQQAVYRTEQLSQGANALTLHDRSGKRMSARFTKE